MSFLGGPHVHRQIVPAGCVEPLVSEKLLDMPNRAAIEEKRCGHGMPENMSTYLLAKVRPSGDMLEDVFHRVIGKTDH